MIRKLVAAVCCAAVAAPAAVAQNASLAQAYAAGQIGERYDGYIGVAAPVTAAVRSQVSTINIRRRTIYSNFAGQKRVAPHEVGITAGCNLLAGVQVGEVYMLADGAWRRRAPGQDVQMPDYCGRR
jgi:uncharacterized protein YdbL (DUF1318 family)